MEGTILMRKEPEEIIGYYEITGNGTEGNSVRFLFTKKPSIIKRFFNKILIGWVWFDNVKQNYEQK